MKFELPPKITKSNGEKRRVGFELEFGGLSIPETADILTGLFGGEVSQESMYTATVSTKLGDFQIEADSNFLKKKKYEKYLELVGLHPSESGIGKSVEDMVGMLAGTLIPFEVVSPPLVIDQLDAVEKIRNELFRHSARGTKSAIFMAFGMQFNPEVPSKDVGTLLSYLRAFFILFDWLYEESDIPVSRRVAPFIHDFPEEYMSFVLNPEYKPTLERFMRDYIEQNMTRNRPLDLLPLFADIDRELVFSYPVEHDLVKARPTFHYRLPNSMVDDPKWKIASDWNKWVEVERLASDKHRLSRMTDDYFATRGANLLFVHSKWAAKTRDWLHG